MPKQKRYWLGGLVVGLGVAIILTLIISREIGRCYVSPDLPENLPSGLCIDAGLFAGLKLFFTMLPLAVVYFVGPIIVGTGIGLLYGKIKNRNKLTPNS